MDYIEHQFNKIFEAKGENFNLKIQTKEAHTNWLSITEHEAELIKDILKEGANHE
jgi:methyl coenzyme M reductase subunit D